MHKECIVSIRLQIIVKVIYFKFILIGGVLKLHLSECNVKH